MTAQILFALLVNLLVGVGVIYSYYASSHAESGGEVTGTYLLVIALAYGLYKAVFFKKNTRTFSALSLAGYTIAHIAILSGLYFLKVSSNVSLKYAFVLFFKILGYLALPLVVVLIACAIGRFVVKHLFRVAWAQEVQEGIFRFVTSLGMGFALLVTALMILASAKLYTSGAVIGLLVVFAGLSHKELWELVKSATHPLIETKNHSSKSLQSINFNLLTGEICFLAITFLLGVNLISIVRSMPIGWDDLGVYMNFPRIMAQNGEILHGVGMIAWQLFTGIGHLFNSAAQAFFLNNVGGILSLVVIIASVHSLLGSEKKSYLNLPFLSGLILYAMPMIVFQQAKDMKLDPGLLFLSVIPLYITIYLAKKWHQEGFFDSLKNNAIAAFKAKPEVLVYALLIGVFLGIAFSVKIISLLLILGVMGVVFYAFGWLLGYLGYFFLFTGTFTVLKLWTFLSMPYPTDAFSVYGIGSILLVIGGALLFALAKQKNIARVSGAFVFALTMLFATFITLSPWLVKNITETLSTQKSISMGTLLLGSPNFERVDMSKLYTPEQIKEKEAKMSMAITASGTTTNEDMGRYFGYESGLNNYARLPWNLTHQLNQPGEYTEISYVYLALIPGILLFLPAVTPFFALALVLVIAVSFAYFTNFGPLGASLTALFSQIMMPQGYLFILASVVGALSFFVYTLKKNTLTDMVKLTLAFLGIYGVLFLVCGFGIVWYGIMVYYAFILLIVLSLEGIYSHADEKPIDESDADIQESVQILASFAMFFVIFFYFLNSALPHGLANLKASAFDEFKSGLTTQEESIFRGHPEYVQILNSININNPEKAVDTVLDTLSKTNAHTPYLQIVQKVLQSKGIEKNLVALREFNYMIFSTADLSKLFKTEIDAATQNAFRLSARALNQAIYELLLQPPHELRNTGKIYRIGTFLTYYITNNYSRYYEDNLVQLFDSYFADEQDIDKAVERMKAVGLKYLLVDLNAATIDRNDPRHDLTRRFELLLKTMQSTKLKLVQTDSPCLQYALDKKRNTPEFLATAGVNYESYVKTASGTTEVVNRGVKLAACYNELIKVMSNEGVSAQNYPYLQTVAQYLQEKSPKDTTEVRAIMDQLVGHGWMALFEIQ